MGRLSVDAGIGLADAGDGAAALNMGRCAAARCAAVGTCASNACPEAVAPAGATIVTLVMFVTFVTRLLTIVVLLSTRF